MICAVVLLLAAFVALGWQLVILEANVREHKRLKRELAKYK